MDLSSTAYQPAPKIAFRMISDRAVIVHPVENRIITLNETGTEIWARLDGRTIMSIVDDLEKIFDISREQLVSDTVSFLTSMEEKNLVELCDPKT